MGFLCERSRGGCLLCEISSRLTAIRDRRRRGCYARSVRGGGDGAVQKRERDQEEGRGGEVRGYDILENGLWKIFP